MNLSERFRTSFGWAVALVGAASVAWFGVFPFRSSAVVFALAAIAPAFVSAVVLTSVQSRARLKAAIAGIVTVLVIGALLSIVDGYSPLGVLSDGTVLGWKQVLTVALPVPAEYPYLIAPLILTGCAATLSVLGRGRASWLLFAPAAIVWTAGILLGVGGPLGAFALAAPLCAVSLARLADLSGLSGRARAVGAGSAVAVVAACAVASVLLAPVASGLVRDEPFDPRSFIEPPITTDALADPLDQLAVQLLSTGGEPVLRLETSEPISSKFIEVATYSTFNGVQWRIPGTASPVGGALAGGSSGSTVVTETITGSALTAPWVPHTGEVISVDTPGLLAFKESGVLLDPVEPPRNKYELQVTSPPEGAAGDYSPAQTSDDVLLDVSCLPAYFRDGMAAAAEDAVDVTARIAASRQWLVKSSGLTFANNAPSGQSCSRLELLAKQGGDRRASSEQTATILTLGLRSQGIPARLAYGYRLGQPGPDGVYAPTSSSALAYTQVLLDPVGWVGVDASPLAAGAVAGYESDLPEINRQSQLPIGDHKDDTPAPLRQPVGDPVPWTALGFLALIVATVAGLVGWLVYCARHRRKVRLESRRQTDLRAQVVSAWIEAIAALSACDIPVVAATIPEVARASREIPGAGDAVWELSSIVEHALYDPRPMPKDAGRRAFDLADVIAAAVAADSSRLDRLRAKFDPRSAAEVVGAGTAT